RTRRFALNVIGARAKHLEDYFYSAASRRPDNLDAVAGEDSPDGLPLLREAMATLECRVTAAHTTGDHTVFIASIERVRWCGDDRPMTSQDLEYVYVGEVVRRR